MTPAGYTTRRDVIKAMVGTGLAIAVLGETGCESVTSTLELIVDTTSAAVDIAFPQYAALLNPYFTAVGNFIDQASTELASADTVAQKAAAIAGYAAAIITPDLSGVAASVVTKIAAIAPLIAKLIDEVKGLSAAVDATPGGANAFFAAHKSYKSPSAKDLAKVRKKLAAMRAKLKH